MSPPPTSPSLPVTEALEVPLASPLAGGETQLVSPEPEYADLFADVADLPPLEVPGPDPTEPGPAGELSVVGVTPTDGSAPGEAVHVVSQVLASTTLSGTVETTWGLLALSEEGQGDGASTVETLTETLRSAQGPPEEAVALSDAPAALSPTVPPDRPVLVVHGIGGSFPSITDYEDWLVHRGIHPSRLLLDPLMSGYDSLIGTLERSGYTQGVDLFAANYDWRVTPGPVDGVIDGEIQDANGTPLTADDITDGRFNHGVDYFGYWLARAAVGWASAHGGVLPADVDVVAHSTGGLVVRVYLQSAAYGGAASITAGRLGDGVIVPAGLTTADGVAVTSSLPLPKVHNLVTMGVPMRGAPGPFQLSQDDWGSDVSYIALGKVMAAAYEKYFEGVTITGPGATDIPGYSGPDYLSPVEFIALYCPTLVSLTGTYPFVFDDPGHHVPAQIVEGNRTVSFNRSQFANRLVIDLNDGLDLLYTPGQLASDWSYTEVTGQPHPGRLHLPTFFVGQLTGDLTVVYTATYPTASALTRRVGPAGFTEFGDFDVTGFCDFIARDPDPGEVWYVSNQAEGTAGRGDGSVPVESSIGLYSGIKPGARRDPNTHLHLVELSYAGSESHSHTGMLASRKGLFAVLDALDRGVAGFIAIEEAASGAVLLSYLKSSYNCTPPSSAAASLQSTESRAGLQAPTGTATATFTASQLGEVALALQQMKGLILAGFANTNPVLSQQLALLGRSLGAGPLAVSSVVAGTLDVATSAILALPSGADSTQVLAALGTGGLLVGGGVANATASRLIVNVRFVVSAESGSVLLSLGPQAAELGIVFTVAPYLTLTDYFTLDALLDIDIARPAGQTVGLLNFAAAQGIFYDDRQIAGAVNMGTLGARSISDGEVSIEARAEQRLMDPSGDRRLSTAELAAAPVESVSAVEGQGTVEAALPTDTPDGKVIHAQASQPFATDPDIVVDSLNFEQIKARLTQLLDALAAVGEALRDPLVQTALQVPLPFLDDPNNDTIDELLTDDRYGFGLDEFFNLVDVLREYCDEVSEPNLAGFVDRLVDALRYRLGEDGGGGLAQGPISVRGGFDVDGNTFNLVLETDLERVFDTELTEEGFGPEANGLGLDLAIPATATVGFQSEIALGMDLSGILEPPAKGITKNDVTLQVNRLHASVDLSVPDIDASATLGFLTAGIVDGRATLTAAVDFEMNGGLPTTLAQLQSVPATSLVTVVSVPTGRLDVLLPLTANVGGSDLTAGCSPSITIVDGNVFDAAAPTVTTSDFACLRDFCNLSPTQVLAMLKGLGDWLAQFRDSSVFGTTVPFASGTTLGDLFDFSKAFVDAIYDQLVQREIVAIGEATASVVGLGRIAFDANFDLQLGSGTPVRVQVRATDTSANASLEQLADTFNNALTAAGLGAAVEAKVTSNRRLALGLKRGSGVSTFNVTVPDPDGSNATPNTDAMVAEIGFGSTQYSVETPNYDGITEFSDQLSAALATAGVPLDVKLTYLVGAKELRMDVDFRQGISRVVSFRFDSDLGLGPLVDASASGTLSFTGEVHAGFTLGFDLNPRTTPRILTSPLVPPPSTGLLTRPASFTLKLDDTRYELTVPVDPTNSSLADLVADINAQFTDSNGLRSRVIAQVSGNAILLSALQEDVDGDGVLDVGEDLNGNHALDQQLGRVNSLQVLGLDSDSFFAEVGFVNGQVDRADVAGLFVDDVRFDGSATLAPTELGAAFRFGVFSISVADGVAIGTFSVQVALQSPFGSTRFLLADLKAAAPDFGGLLKVAPVLLGGIDIQAPTLTITPDLFDLPTGQGLRIYVPDLHFTDYNSAPYDAATNNHGLFVTLPTVGGLGNFNCLTFLNLVQSLDAVADELEAIQGFGFLGQPIPLINRSIGDLLDSAGNFADLVEGLATGDADTLATLETELEAFFRVSDPNLITLSVDDASPAPFSGGSPSTRVATPFNPVGVANAIRFTAREVGTTHQGVLVEFVDDGRYTGITDDAAVAFDSIQRTLRIFYHAGYTTAARVVAVVNGATTQPFQAALDTATEAGAGTGTITLTALKFSLHYHLGYGDFLPLDLNLNDLVALLPATDPARTLLGGLSSFVQLEGSANLDVSASADLLVEFGVDVSNPCAWAPFLYDSTGLTLDAAIRGTDIAFTAAVGPLGVFVKDGTVTVDRDGDPDTTGPGEDAEFRAGLTDDDGDGRHYLRDAAAILGDLSVTLTAGASAALPLCFPTESVPVGSNRDDNHDGHPDNELVVDIPSLGDLFDRTGFPVHLTTPDLAGLMADFNVCDLVTNASVLLDGLDALLGVIQDGLRSEVLGRNLPLVGDDLATAGDFIGEFREGLLADIRARLAEAGDPIGLVKQAFWNVLGRPGLNLLVDGAGNPIASADAIPIVCEQADGEVQLVFDIHLSRVRALVDTTANPIHFDIGIPGLGLSVDGNVKIEIGFTLNLRFGISSKDGFFFDTNGSDDDSPLDDLELSVFFRVTVPGLSATGNLLFLQAQVSDEADGRDALGASRRSTLFEGHFDVDLFDASGRVSFGKMIGGGFNLGRFFVVELAAVAEVHLDLEVSFGADARFPRLLAEFDLTWSWDPAGGTSGEGSDGALDFGFRNLQLDLGSFIGEFLGPVLSQINAVVEPIKPLVDLLTTPLPIFSDLDGGPLTLLKLGENAGLIAPTTRKFIEAVDSLFDLMGTAATFSSGSLLINLGSFDLLLDALGKIGAKGTLPEAPIDPAAATTDPGAQGFLEELEDLGVTFPFLKISELFKLFTGQPVSFVEFHLPLLEFEASIDFQIPIFPPLYIIFGGSIGARIDLTFGYDSFGVQKYFSDPDRKIGDLFEGFYVKDVDDDGNEITELTLSGGLFAGAELDILVASAGVTGGINADILFDLRDPDGDGRVRAAEIAANIASNGPLCIFDVSGRIYVSLDAFLKVNLLIAKIDKEWNFGEITLLEFAIECPDPILASFDTNGDGTETAAEIAAGQLVLHQGEYAALRKYGDTADGSERFTVRPVSALSGGEQSVEVSFGGITQTYHHVKSILAKAGAGSDTVDLTGVAVAGTVYGGDGDDVLKASRGGGTYYGDNGNDTLESEAATGDFVGVADQFHGGAGNDSLDGREGDDHLYGDDGDDVLVGGPGNDTETGGEGNDTLAGDAGTDTLSGEGGFDALSGGEDDDVLTGGEGDDSLVGDAGNDRLVGGSGDDTLDGGTGNDVLVGDDGVIVSLLKVTGVSGDGDDVLAGGPGADTLLGAGGDDALFGGTHLVGGSTTVMTVVYRVSGSALVVEPDGADFLDGGEGNDVLFADDSHSGSTTSSAVTGTEDDAEADAEVDAGPPTVSIGDASVVEGDSGAPFLSFPVSLSSAATQDVTVAYRTGIDAVFATPDARPGVDFQSTEYTLVFHPGVVSLSVLVPVLPDLEDEPDELVLVTLSDAYRGTEALTLTDSVGSGTILDDDATPTVSVGDASVNELDGGNSVQLVFTVSLSNPSWQTLRFDWRLLQVTKPDGSPAEDTATVGVDYVDETGTVTFTEGTTLATFDVTIRGDNIDEYDERLLALLARNTATPASAFAFADDTAIGTILDDNPLTPATNDDDPTPFVSIRTVTAGPFDEGQAGNRPVELELSLSRASGRPVDVTWSTARGTALESASLVEAADFVAAFQTTRFEAGSTTARIQVQIVGDTVRESDEDFFVNLISAVNGRIGTTSARPNHAVVKIHDDESTDPGPWYVQFADRAYSVTEGGLATITLVRAGNSSLPVAVYWASGGTATPGVDYDPTLNPDAPGGQRGLVRFGPGETLKTFTIATYDNQTTFGQSIYEGDETVLLYLANPTGGAVRGLITDATLTIVENDPAPVITIGDATSTGHFALEKRSDGTAGSLSFVVSVSGVSDLDVTVRYTSISGTATAEDDFVTTTGFLTFPAAHLDVPQTVAIATKDDVDVEDIEDLFVVLSDPVNGTIGDSPLDSDATGGEDSDDRGFGIILDDDLGVISGVVFADANGNGFRDPSTDSGYAGVRVTFVSETSGATYAATTTATGSYAVSLPLDDYTVSVDESALPEGAAPTSRVLPFGYAFAVPTASLDLGFAVPTTAEAPAGSMGSSSTGSNDTVYGGGGNDLIDGGAGDDWLIGGHWLGPGCSCDAPGYDVLLKEILAGAVRTRVYVDPATLPAPGTISGRVWIDSDGDNTELKATPGNESGLAGVPVNLYDENWTLVATAYTGANGGYSFTNLAACDYQVLYLLPGGFTFVAKGVGGSANDSDADATLGLTGALTVAAGRTVANVDAGIRALPAGAAPWNVSFERAVYAVRETDGHAVIGLLGDGASLLPVGVYFTSDGTATVALDYLETRGAVRFGAGESAKLFLVPIVADDVAETYETILLTLRNPTGGDVKGAQRTAVILVFDAPCPDDDIVSGGDGNDVLLGDFGWFADSGTAVLLGGMGNDSLAGGEGGDRLYGEGGDDLLEGGTGDDILDGGSENDRYAFDTDVVLGTDTVVEGVSPLGGADTFDFSTTGLSLDLDLATTSLTILDGTTTVLVLNFPADVIENVVAGAGNDVLRGNLLANVLDGGAGDDTLEGRAGDDDLTGGPGNDTYLFDADTLLGHDDVFEAGDQDTDTIDFGATTAQAVSLDLGLTTSQAVAPTLTLTLQTADSRQTILAIGGQLVVVRLVAVPFSGTTASTGIENLYGGRFAPGTGTQDRLVGNTRDNVIWGREGNDVLSGGTNGYDTLKEERAGNWTLSATSLANATTGEIDTFTAGTFDEISLTGDGADNRLDASSFAGIVRLDGAGGADTLVGGTGTNYLTGGAGNDRIDGSRGHDILIESRDKDFVLTATTLRIGGEIDTLIGTIEEATLTGGPGPNELDATGFNGTVTLDGGDGDDTLLGSSQDDVLIGGGGNDSVAGGDGDDTYRFDADSPLGADTLTEAPGGGTDTLDFAATESLGVTLSLGVTGAQPVNGNLTLTLSVAIAFEDLLGSQQDDVLTGNRVANRIVGNEGSDRVSGGEGRDTLDGGTGIRSGGQPFHDVFVEVRDADLILTSTALRVNGAAEDTLTGFEAAELTGGEGNNLLDASGFGGPVRLDGGVGNDTLRGSGDDDTLIGGPGNDALLGADGDDVYLFDTDENLGADSVDDAAGNDTLDFSATTGRTVQVSLASTLAQVVNPNLSLTLVSGRAIENLRGGGRNDDLTGNDLDNLIEGGDGKDRLSGGQGDDLLVGGLGDDTYAFALGSGNPLGTDTVFEDVGDGGSDTLEFNGSVTSGVTLDLGVGHLQAVHANLGLQLIRAHSIENVLGSSASDIVVGNSLNNRIEGRGGDDVLSGGLGDDTYAFDADSALGSDRLTEEPVEGGYDTLDFSATSSAVGSVVAPFSLRSIAPQVVNGFLTVTLSDTVAFDQVMPGSGPNFLSPTSQPRPTWALYRQTPGAGAILSPDRGTPVRPIDLWPPANRFNTSRMNP